MLYQKDVISVKIEKINDNQIRCTLTKDDLASRQIKLSELAYGSEKAKNLFRDMMLQAQAEYGFEADNIPLMIEAIPISPESIVLIVTKVEDPEELDTRFSKFSPMSDDDIAVSPESPDIFGADDILDIFHKLHEGRTKKSAEKNEKKEEKTEERPTEAKDEPVKEEKKPDLTRIFSFQKLDTIIQASHSLNQLYDGMNTLYKNKDDSYQLILHQSACTPENYNKVCNILSEYGLGKACSPAKEAHLKEHAIIMIADNALQQLSRL